MDMCDGPIEIVEYIWVNIDGCLIGFGHKAVEIHSFFVQLVN